MMRRALLAGLAVALGAGCAGPTLPPEDAPAFRVERSTAFYALGPLQAGPPDARLDAGARVLVLRREFGYSYARLGDGRRGYLANEDLAPAPAATPEPSPPPRPLSPRTSSRPSKPLPPVEEPLPRPDLEAAPADAPPL